MAADLLDEFARWVDAHRTPDADNVVNSVDTFLSWWDGAGRGDLSSLGEEHLREFLLRWCPRHLSAAPEESAQICGALADFIDFLAETRRLPRRAAPLARVTLDLADAMQAAMADPSNWGMSKTLFAGIVGAESMSEDELRAALARRVEEHNALPLEQRRAATDAFFDAPPAALELPFLHVPPPEAEVAAAAASAELPARIQALRDYLGENGKTLTAKGNLKLADGRALVEILDTGDEMDPAFGDRIYRTRSTADLSYLSYLLAVADAAGAVRVVNNRLVPVKAWARRAPVDAASKLFDTVLEYGVMSMNSHATGFYGEMHDFLDDGVPHWLSRLLDPGLALPFDKLLELHQHMLSQQLDGYTAEYYQYEGGLARDLSRIVSVLALTGAVAWTDRTQTQSKWGPAYDTGGTITMTALGRHALLPLLPAAGIELRSAEDVTDLELADLIDVMADVPHEQHSALLQQWRPALTATERAALVSALIAEADDAHTRLVGLRLLGMFDTAVAESQMRQLLDSTAAGHAAIWLLEEGLADADSVSGFITPAVLLDMLSLLVDEPDELCRLFLAGHHPEDALEFFWRHRAPETAEVLDILGRHLPDAKLAKQARKAAMRHRSWIANRGLG